KRAGETLAEFGSLAAYFWQFEPEARSRPRRLTPEVLGALTTSPESVSMSKDLKRRGWTFVGPTTVYAFMQAMGLVNDHLEGCRSRPLALAERRARSRSPSARRARPARRGHDRGGSRAVRHGADDRRGDDTRNRCSRGPALR